MRTILLILALLISSSAFAQSTSSRVTPLIVLDNPAITITTGTADSTATSTPTAREAQVFWKFGTVSGTFNTCTVTAKTTYDGNNYLTIGTAISITATTGTGTAWSLYGQTGTTSVTTSAPSTTAVLSFGVSTKFTFACNSYGTSAPVSISVIYK